MNGWGATTAFEDKGEGRYFVEYELAVGTYGFKIAVRLVDSRSRCR